MALEINIRRLCERYSLWIDAMICLAIQVNMIDKFYLQSCLFAMLAVAFGVRFGIEHERDRANGML